MSAFFVPKNEIVQALRTVKAMDKCRHGFTLKANGGLPMKLLDSKSRIKLNLQFFADPAGELDSDDGDKQDNSTDKDKEQQEMDPKNDKKYSDADVDRIVGEKYAKFEKQKQKEVDEAKKLAKMNKDEKQKFEMDKLKSDAQSARDELAKYQMRDTAKQMISDGGVAPTDEMVDLVTSSDADTTKSNVVKVLNFAKSIREQVTKELSQGTTPRTVGSPALSKEDIMKIQDTDKRQEAIKNNLGLFGINNN